MRIVFALLLAAAPAHAQWWLGGGSTSGTEACTRENTWTVEPRQVDTYTFQFDGRTINATPTPVVAVSTIKQVQADATPGQIITAGPAVAGSQVTVTINPDNGCGTAGCRSGNWYQLDLTPTDSNANEPTAAACIYVKPVKLSPQ